MIHLRRLIKGLIYFGVTLIFALNYGEILDSFWSFLIANGHSNEWLGAVKVLGFPVFAFFIVGLYFIFTFHLERNPVFENSWKVNLTTGPRAKNMGGSNIDNMKRYRDSVLATKTQSAGAKEYMKTAWLDGIDNIGGNNTSSVKRFINSKLASMDNQGGYEWLKKNSK